MSSCSDTVDITPTTTQLAIIANFAGGSCGIELSSLVRVGDDYTPPPSTQQ